MNYLILNCWRNLCPKNYWMVETHYSKKASKTNC